MYSSAIRLQNVFGFFTTIATVVACLIAATDLLHTRTPSATVQPAGLQVVRGRAHYYSKKQEEYAVVRFHLDADLTSLFTWNTKEVFVYVTAEWAAGGPGAHAHANTSASASASSAVVWDKIITSPSSDRLANLGPATLRKLRKSAAGKAIDPSRGLLHLRNERPKYQITHPSGKIAETDQVRLRVHYNVQPWVGFLSWSRSGTVDAEGSGSSGSIGSSSSSSMLDWLLPAPAGLGSPLWAPMAGGVSKAFDLPAVGVKGGSGSSQKTAAKARSSA